MKVLIPVGGVGKRLWPLSRRSKPKQFQKVIGDKSVISSYVGHYREGGFKMSDIYLCTGREMVNLMYQERLGIPKQNILGEPCRLDNGPAIGYLLVTALKKFPDEPVLIAFHDHYLKKPKVFSAAARAAGQYAARAKKICFIGVPISYPTANLGYIHIGKNVARAGKFPIYAYKSWHYRPDVDEAREYMHSGEWLLNPSYYVGTPRCFMKLYEKYAPNWYGNLMRIYPSVGTAREKSVVRKYYPKMEKNNIDDVIWKKMKSGDINVLAADFGFNDIGAWEILQEALVERPKENVSKGRAIDWNSRDCLMYNYNPKKLLATVGLEETIIVDMNDVLLVVKKDRVKEIRDLLKKIEAEGGKKYL